MTTNSLLHAAPTKPGPPTGRTAAPVPLAVGAASSCHYLSRPRSRKVVVFSALFSAALHAALIVNFHYAKKKDAPPPPAPVIGLSLEMPDIKELEDPEPKTEEDTGDTSDLSVSVPMQMDLPRPPQLGDFVQQLDFSSFIEHPNTSQDKMWSIPAGRHGGKIGEGMGNIFNLADLERAPEPVLQPAPVYPASMRREAVTATVIVEFIVDTHGRVLNAFAVDTTNFAFNSAAVTGVEKWKFRAGIRGGRKVNTRLRVPIIFNVVDALD